MKVLFTSIFALFLATSAWATGELSAPATCDVTDLGVSSGTLNVDLVWEANRINTSWYTGYGDNTQITGANIPTSCNYDSAISLPSAPSRPGYVFNGWRLKCTIPATDINTAPLSGTGHGWYNNADVCYYNYAPAEAGSVNCSTVSDLSLNQWKVSWSNGDVVRGIASCQSSAPSDILYLDTNVELVMGGEMDAETFLSGYTALAGQEKVAIAQQALTAYAQEDETTAMTLFYQLLIMPSNTNYTTNDTGQYCFCQATHYTANNAQQCSLSSPSWVFGVDYGSAADCADVCASDCGYRAMYFSDFHAALFTGLVAQ